MVLAITSMIATAAPAETDVSAHDGELDRWVASGGIEMGIYGHRADAQAQGRRS